jgi:hypothetical protein
MGIDRIPKKFQKKRNNKNDANDNEKLLASELNVKNTRGSGSQDKDKGDLVSEKFLIEMKQTKFDSIVLKKEWLTKIKKEAEDRSKFWSLYVSFVDTNNKVIEDGFFISKEIFKKLLEEE